MNQINQLFAGKRAGASAVATAIVFSAIGMAASSFAGPAGVSRAIRSQFQGNALRLAAEPAHPVAQNGADDDDKEVPTRQVDKYINVYAAMQKDHNLTVEQAASKQGLTVAQFRDLENKIEADDMLRERVRKALRHAANPKETDSSDE